MSITNIVAGIVYQVYAELFPSEKAETGGGDQFRGISHHKRAFREFANLRDSFLR